jgi:hypothetical protein
MPSEARVRLAHEQAQLVQALDGSAAAPAGFDTKRLGLAARCLIRKRADAVARVWPLLPATLGSASFHRAFAAFAVDTPLAAEGGALAEGRALVAWCAGKIKLPDELRLQAFLTDLTHRRYAVGLRRRRGIALRAAWLCESRRLALGVRLPLVGVRWLSLPLRVTR